MCKDRPLTNKRIVVTRNIAKADELIVPLRRMGAVVEHLPTFEVATIEHPEIIADLKESLNVVDWIFLTSENGAEALFQLVDSSDLSQQLKFIVYGKKTAQCLLNNGIEPFVTIQAASSTEFVEQLTGMDLLQENEKGFLLQGDLASDQLLNNLSHLLKVQRRNIYENRIPVHYPQNIVEDIKNGLYDLILFTSPSSFMNLLTMMEPSKPAVLKSASMGKVTTRAMKDQGYEPLVQPDDPSLDRLIDAVVDYFKDSATRSN